MNSHQDRQKTEFKSYRDVLFITMCSVALCALALPYHVHAAPLTPGAVISPIDKPVYQPKPSQTPDISRQSKAAPAPQSSVKVKVNSFQFVGNTTYNDDVLRSVIAKYEGQTLSITDI